MSVHNKEEGNATGTLRCQGDKDKGSSSTGVSEPIVPLWNRRNVGDSALEVIVYSAEVSEYLGKKVVLGDANTLATLTMYSEAYSRLLSEGIGHMRLEKGAKRVLCELRRLLASSIPAHLA